MRTDVNPNNMSGHKINPSCETHRMVTASGQKVTITTAGTDYTKTVVAGARYAVTADKTGVVLMGIATVATGSEANILWAVGANGTIGIEIPVGVTVLHFTADTSSSTAWIAQIDDTQ
jgi:hypothetical protein